MSELAGGGEVAHGWPPATTQLRRLIWYSPAAPPLLSKLQACGFQPDSAITSATTHTGGSSGHWLRTTSSITGSICLASAGTFAGSTPVSPGPASSPAAVMISNVSRAAIATATAPRPRIHPAVRSIVHRAECAWAGRPVGIAEPGSLGPPAPFGTSPDAAPTDEAALSTCPIEP